MSAAYEKDGEEEKEEEEEEKRSRRNPVRACERALYSPLNSKHVLRVHSVWDLCIVSDTAMKR